jgi:protein ImuB
MAAMGKTLDLFETTALQPQLKDELKPQPHRVSKSRPAPALEIAPPPRPLAEEIQLRAELWLAIYFPRLPLEALTRGDAIRPSTASHDIPSDHLMTQPAFPSTAREVQPGSRRSSTQEQRSQGVQPPVSFDASASGQEMPRPTVIVDLAHNQQRVVACNPAAVQAGILPGMGLNGAYALASDLQVQGRDIEAEEQWLERLAQWAGSFTSRVSLESPDVLLLEIKGSLKLFGGHQSLRDLIQTGLQRKRVQAVLAVAPTSMGALAFSRAGQASVCLKRSQLPAALSAVPIAALRWPDEVTAMLSAMGVQTVGDCLRLPREGFARRFGPELLLQLDQLLGRAPQPRRNFVARERFVMRQDFETEIEAHEQLLLTMKPLIQSLESHLRPRQTGVQSLEIRFRHRSRDATRLVLRFVRPMADAAHCLAILAERLQRLELPAPVIAARVRSGPVWPLDLETIPHRALADPTQQAPQAMARLIERLRARLGAEAVYSLHCVAEHRPELASQPREPELNGKPKRKRLEKSAPPESPTSRPADQLTSRPASSSPRPFWLLPQPQRLQVQRHWPQFEGRLELLQGPERIESGWWDGHDISRDYYIASTQQGLRLWIYRERRTKQWYVHGIYG